MTRVRMCASVVPVVAVACASIVAVACGGGGSRPTATAGSGQGGGVASPTPAGRAEVQQLCAATDDLKSSISSLAASQSLDDLKSRAKTAEDAADSTRSAAHDARIAAADRLDTAVDDFRSSIDSATSSDQPFGETLVAVGTAVLRLQDSVDEARNEGGC